MTPIWRDITADLGTSATGKISYIVRMDATQIYAGVAVNKPGDTVGTTHIYVTINDIIEDYVKQTVLNWDDAGWDAAIPAYHLSHTFTVWVNSYCKLTADVCYNWSYGTLDGFDVFGDKTDLSGSLGAPITGEIPVQCPAPFSFLQNANGYTINTNGGPVSVVAQDNGVNYLHSFANAGDYAYTNGGDRYTAKDMHCRYVLYYVNAYGGWDALPIHSYKQTDSIARSEMQHNPDRGSNVAYKHREKENYLNSITRSWTMHTGWLTDQQSMRMRHLLESNTVYLVDLEHPGWTEVSGEDAAPVIIRNADCPRKIFRTENAMVAYELEVELAQTRIRK